MTVIEAENISKTYSLYQHPADCFLCAAGLGKRSAGAQKEALQSISFSVKEGEAVGVIGSNGSGKSTLLKIIAGVLKPDSGKLRLRGRVSALLELGAGFHPEYTGVENVLLNGRIMGISRLEMERRLPEILSFADIGEYAYQPVKTYSSGMFARLAFASAVHSEAGIVLVDEALSVGDTFFQNRCFRKFEDLKKGGTTLLLVSHDLETVRRMTDRTIWIEHGKIRMEGESREVCNAYSAEIHRKENEDFLTTETLKGADSLPSMDRENTVAAGNEKSWNPDLYPQITVKQGDILNDSVRIRSCFLEDQEGKPSAEIHSGEEVRLVIVLETGRDLPQCIVGYVLQNRRGVSIVNSNTLTVSRGQTFHVRAGEICRVAFSFKVPELYEDEYLIDCAVANGPRVMENEMLVWHYGAQRVMLHNEHPCLAIMNIPAEVQVDRMKSCCGEPELKRAWKGALTDYAQV